MPEETFDGWKYLELEFDAEEMRKLFPDDKYPDACDNTLKIADRIHYKFDFDQDYLPDFPVDDDSLTAEEYLRKKVLIGAEDKYQDISNEVLERIVTCIIWHGVCVYLELVGSLAEPGLELLGRAIKGDEAHEGHNNDSTIYSCRNYFNVFTANVFTAWCTSLCHVRSQVL